MIFQQEDKYYILDWKSNLLGGNQESFSNNLLLEEMKQADYLLQYHLYTIALHRFLSQSQGEDYDYDLNFGESIIFSLEECTKTTIKMMAHFSIGHPKVIEAIDQFLTLTMKANSDIKSMFPEQILALFARTYPDAKLAVSLPLLEKLYKRLEQGFSSLENAGHETGLDTLLKFRLAGRPNDNTLLCLQRTVIFTLGNTTTMRMQSLTKFQLGRMKTN